LFLYIVPLKQGLKLSFSPPGQKWGKPFLYIVPLKQGLKLSPTMATIDLWDLFLYIVPLKQGLKPKKEYRRDYISLYVFIHSSIKTRIETIATPLFPQRNFRFLYIVPLKQGLKLPIGVTRRINIPVFIHSSIKTRIETPYIDNQYYYY